MSWLSKLLNKVGVPTVKVDPKLALEVLKPHIVGTLKSRGFNPVLTQSILNDIEKRVG